MRFRSAGAYAVAPALAPASPNEQFAFEDFSLDLTILKKQLRVVPAWELGRNDPDSSVICADDDPIIPSGVTNAPVLAVLDRKRESTETAV